MILGKRLHLERNHIQNQLSPHNKYISNKSINESIVYSKQNIISIIRKKYGIQIKINQKIDEEVFITIYDWSNKIITLHILILLWLVSPEI